MEYDGKCGKHGKQMSVRPNFLYDSMPWTKWGGPIAFGGFGVGYKKSIAALGGVQPKHSNGYVFH